MIVGRNDTNFWGESTPPFPYLSLNITLLNIKLQNNFCKKLLTMEINIMNDEFCTNCFKKIGCAFLIQCNKDYLILKVKNWEIILKNGVTIIIIIIIMSCRQHGYPWPSLATSPYRSSPPAGLQGYILCPHIVAVCKFELVVSAFARPYVGVHRSTSQLFLFIELKNINDCSIFLLLHQKFSLLVFYMYFYSYNGY